MYVANITQQPNDERDYDIDFSEWFPDGDPITAATLMAAPTGLTLSYAISPTVVKVWIGGGVSGATYKVTLLAATAVPRRKEVELKVRIKDY